MQQPPLLPVETLARVLRLAKFDGTGVLVFGTIFAIGAAASGDVPFAVVGLLAAGAGAIELHGHALLREGETRGINWLVASQPLLLLVILGYCALRLTHFEIPPIPDNWRDMIAMTAEKLGMTVDQYFRMVNRITVQLLAILSVFYQGGMTLYYYRRREAVTRALAVE